ncbi:DNA-binding response regulator [Marinobacter salinus]|uniref:DNA-binding response regulator n=1 Tax=Marinobacter salinus TaxID=1874317 RepID=A0A1D9GM50_9GAMM|nr:response regulator [Marinobacter salinus]AOY88575.1 DNA-binding response regulator [Marinobacter salinus]
MNEDQNPQILVVDDHREIRDLLGRYLSDHGFRVVLAGDGAAMKNQLRNHRISLVLLDIMMPGDDGLVLCRFLREHTSLPVILLTAMGEDTDKIIGLEMGADDYVTKPFNPREVLARIKSVLRRVEALPPRRGEVSGQQLAFNGWHLDVDRRRLTDPDGVEVALSTAEFNLLLVFLNHAGRVLSRDRLLDLAEGREASPFERSIDNRVSRLRRKLEKDPRNPELIKTVWGGGYQWTASVEAG